MHKYFHYRAARLTIVHRFYHEQNNDCAISNKRGTKTRQACANKISRSIANRAVFDNDLKTPA